MSRRLYLRPEAEEEIGRAAEWYEERGFELGSAFLDEVSHTIGVLRSSPELYPLADS